MKERNEGTNELETGGRKELRKGRKVGRIKQWEKTEEFTESNAEIERNDGAKRADKMNYLGA